MITIEDWRPPIVEMLVAKQALAAVDPAGIFPFRYPEVAATEESVVTAERALGIELDAEHRGFLRYADGWDCFYQSVTLLSTAELIRGPLHDAAVEAFDAAPEPLEDLRREASTLLPIAASTVQADVFAMPIDNAVVGRAVFWFAEGELIDTFESFGAYFVSMIDYTHRRAAKMRQAG